MRFRVTCLHKLNCRYIGAEAIDEYLRRLDGSFEHTVAVVPMWAQFKRLVHRVTNNLPWVTPSEGQGTDADVAEAAGCFFHEHFEQPNGEEKEVPEFDHLLSRRGQAPMQPHFAAPPGQSEVFVEEYTGHHVLAEFPSDSFRPHRFAMFLPAREDTEPLLLVELLEEAKGQRAYGSPANLEASNGRPWHFRASVWKTGPDAWETSGEVSFLKEYYQCWHVTRWTLEHLLQGTWQPSMEGRREAIRKKKEKLFKSELYLDWNVLGGACVLWSFPMWDKDDEAHGGKGAAGKKLFFPTPVVEAFKRGPRYQEWYKHAKYVRDLHLFQRGKLQVEPAWPWSVLVFGNLRKRLFSGVPRTTSSFLCTRYTPLRAVLQRPRLRPQHHVPQRTTECRSWKKRRRMPGRRRWTQTSL